MNKYKITMQSGKEYIMEVDSVCGITNMKKRWRQDLKNGNVWYINNLVAVNVEFIESIEVINERQRIERHS